MAPRRRRPRSAARRGFDAARRRAGPGRRSGRRRTGPRGHRSMARCRPALRPSARSCRPAGRRDRPAPVRRGRSGPRAGHEPPSPRQPAGPPRPSPGPDRFAFDDRADLEDRILEIRDRQERARIGNARSGADDGGVQDARIRTASDDDDVIGIGRPRELVDDGARMASGEIERDSPDRIRVNDSASARRADSSAETAPRWTRAADPATTSRATIAQSIGWAWSVASRMTTMPPRAMKEPAKTHQDRRIPRSGASGGAARQAGGIGHFGISGWRPGVGTSTGTFVPRR